jgi:hypothetical protein
MPNGILRIHSIEYAGKKTYIHKYTKYIQACIYLFIYVCVSFRSEGSIPIWTHMCIIYIYTYKYIYIYIHTYIYIYVLRIVPI